MAVEMITWAVNQVFEPFDLSPPERFILMLLADNASFDEELGAWKAFPFQKTLARKSGYDERTVSRAFKRFRQLGLISSEARYKKAGGRAGNSYRFHPDIVDRPIPRTQAVPENPRHDTQSGLENSREDTQSGMPPQAREFKGGHTVRYGTEQGHTRQGVGYHPAESQVPRAKTVAGAPLTVNEPSSSSMSSSALDESQSPAGAGETTTDLKNEGRTSDVAGRRFGLQEVTNARGPVDLDKLAAVVEGQWTVPLDRDQAVWLAEEITGRSARMVGAPDAFVRRSLVNDGHEWQQAVIAHFGTRPGDARSIADDALSDRPCPIRHHAECGWKARSCPGCRKQMDFPALLDRTVYEAMDADVRDLVDGHQAVTIVDESTMYGRTQEPAGRSYDRSAG